MANADHVLFGARALLRRIAEARTSADWGAVSSDLARLEREGLTIGHLDIAAAQIQQATLEGELEASVKQGRKTG